MSEIVIYPTASALAEAVAANFVEEILVAQQERGFASVVLTGGRSGNAVLAQVLKTPEYQSVDWSQVDFYWGDERFLPAGHPDRNETQARQAFLDHAPVDPDRVFTMEPSDGKFGDDPDSAAVDYGMILAERTPAFDVLMLGVGEEGHTASLFPDSPAVKETELSVVAVRDCPKPPPTRVSLTLPAIQQARQVWLVTTGEAKAGPVAAALSGALPVDIPAAGALGTERTVWILDPTAASKLPR
jgi:6-phosphogluconolactonase